VTLYDPTTRQITTAETLSLASAQIPSGRDLVVGISQRNTFIRTLPVPHAPKAELAKIISLKLVPLLPVGGQEYVSGFRIGHSQGQTHMAIVGAVRAEILKSVHSQAKEAGLTVRAILPFAFASWLLAKEHSLNDCAVVERSGDSFTLDLVRGGELVYSRSIPAPESDEEFHLELERTFRIAEVEPCPVLAAGGVDVVADLTDPRPTIQLFADLGAIERLLFSLEPLDRTLARETRIRKAVMARALVATAIAVLFSVYAAIATRTTLLKNADIRASQARNLTRAKAEALKAIANSDRMHESSRVVDAAFSPAQKFSEVIDVLGVSSSPKSWFTGLTLERGKLILIRGDALDGETVAKYVTDLSKDSRFRGMKLVFANKATIGKKPVVQFAISGHVVGNLPLDEVPERGAHV
jgi:hypothetical protein